MDSLDGELESFDCEICFHQFNETTKRPRTMNCGHTLCTDCIDQEITDGHITCPFCRKEHDACSTHDVPVNFALMKVMKALKRLGVGSLEAIDKLGVDKSVSTQVVVEPELHAGVCNDHGAYKLFWCYKCEVWVCRDCACLEHTMSTCSIISISKAFKIIKKEEDLATHDSLGRRDQHIAVLRDHMSAILERKTMHNKLLENLQRLMDGIRAQIVGLENEYERVDRCINSSNGLNEKVIQANEELAGVKTADELIMHRGNTQKCRESIEIWVDNSEEELEACNIMKLAKETQTIMSWVLRVSGIEAVDVTSLQRRMHTCIQEAVIEGGVNVSSLTGLIRPFTICSVLETKNQVALITKGERGVHLHTLCNGAPPTNSIILPYLDVKKFINESMGFVTLEWQGMKFGPVYFTIDHNCPESEAFVRRLIGEDGNPLINSELSSVQSYICLENVPVHSPRATSNYSSFTIAVVACCNGFTTGVAPGKHGDIEDLMKVTNDKFSSSMSGDVANNKVSEKGLSGWVTVEQNRGNASFTVWHQETRTSGSVFGQYPEPPKKLGRVVEGLEIIRELGKQSKQLSIHKIKIIDCGLYF